MQTRAGTFSLSCQSMLLHHNLTLAYLFWDVITCIRAWMVEYLGGTFESNMLHTYMYQYPTLGHTPLSNSFDHFSEELRAQP
jgi:hypothetical protein